MHVDVNIRVGLVSAELALIFLVKMKKLLRITRKS